MTTTTNTPKTSNTKAQQGSVTSPEAGNTQGYQGHAGVHEQSQWDEYQGQQMSHPSDFAFIGSQFDVKYAVPFMPLLPKHHRP
ncbi:hypothetical protein GGTG_13174 [Gaeumannomyces tritici R3-111a-1]|uniref:Uncharacterized protein n=1 Tax=Gaeumannomyces tritici (strain R3-111a-1) TaxID=644352 RepID=J3PI44_GAET3|nr:hypothetical protein GGTG_13174 [Gaeumannomyces tritici R3-111a-1]EJT69556.1 hypothetical protein GGTG_13174 [Gaeumannomyces tritici R3-111a-1]